MRTVRMRLVRPIGQELLSEVSLDDCPFEQFLDQLDRPVQEVLGNGAWIVGIALGHVRQQTQSAVAFDMRPRQERRMIDQGGPDWDGRKARGCHDIEAADFLVVEGDAHPPTGNIWTTPIAAGNRSGIQPFGYLSRSLAQPRLKLECGSSPTKRARRFTHGDHRRRY